MSTDKGITIGEDIRIIKPADDSNPKMKHNPIRPKKGSETPFYKGGKSKFMVFIDYDPTRELAENVVPATLAESLDNIPIDPKEVERLSSSIQKITQSLRQFLIHETAPLPLATKQAWEEAQRTLRFATDTEDLEDEEGLRDFESFLAVGIKIKLMDKVVELLKLSPEDRNMLVSNYIIQRRSSGKNSLDDLRSLLQGLAKNPDPPYGDTSA